MDYQVQLSFENVNSPELGGYGVDHVKVAEGLGCKAIRVIDPDELLPAFEKAKKLMAEYRVPVVVEVILERVTNISMGGATSPTSSEFEELADSPTRTPRPLSPCWTEPTGESATMHVLVAPDKFKGSLTARRGGRAARSRAQAPTTPECRSCWRR